MTPKRVIRASEINSFLFCERAWWYRLQGVPSENQADLQGGQFVHQHQARRVRRAIWAIRLGYVFLFFAILVLIVQFAR